MAVDWDKAAPVFTTVLKAPKRPEKPGDGAIRMAQKSYDGQKEEGSDVIKHVLRHRFATVEIAEAAADELKRAGFYTVPESTVRVVLDPDNEGDNRVVAWSAGAKRGRKT